MASFTDRRAAMFMQKQRNTWELMTSTNVTRVYPSILHLTSSNFNPVPYWNSGYNKFKVRTQMVALNFQTMDKFMEINSAMFQMNGTCGYVLKPTSNAPDRKVLTITVLVD
jgi:Phosphatidylinositol-specific phospholipase C, Y domain